MILEKLKKDEVVLGLHIDTPLTSSKQLQEAAKKVAKAAQKAGIFAGAVAFDPIKELKKIC